jgi:N-6 DNA Methylase
VLQQVPVVTSYESFVAASGAVSETDSAEVHHAILNGQAGAELRRLVTLTDRRALGAFFTRAALADLLVEPLGSSSAPIRVVDPSCGAGDLLLAAARRVGEIPEDRRPTLRLQGVDVVPEFVGAAANRLRLAAKLSASPISVAVRCGDGFEATELRKATHLILNPPFFAMTAAKNCTWASGQVTAAAVFLVSNLKQCSDGVAVYAILPEVLRGGTRYGKWRKEVENHLEIESMHSAGQFDSWTDVDVFILRGKVRHLNEHAAGSSRWVPESNEESVGSRFKISTGPVVHFRDPKKGPFHPFLISKDFPTWSLIKSLSQSRRFAGRVIQPPFVAIPRTSRPGDEFRARGAVVLGDRSVAVENHLIVAQPLDGTAAACSDLLARLRDRRTSVWLDEVIRCRHLTVASIRDLPWWGPLL